MKSSAQLAALVTVAAVGAAASLPTALAATPKQATVTLKDISFKKATTRIARGGSVTWIWKDGSSPHNVTFARRHSRTQKTGTYTLRFATAGTFRYHCTIHPGMDGKVVVAAAS
ncbi:MAG: amidase [Conexibacter sp.]|nr:amidase [Conexibacter sp.]